MSLYGSLYKYRERPSRSPLEDYLTESLADLLNRLSPAVNARFVNECLLRSSDSEARDLVNEISDASQVRWHTQVTIDASGNGRRPDLVLLVDGVVLGAVEVKISAAYTRGSDTIEEADEENPGIDRNQLAEYARWVDQHPTAKALVLLTLQTEPPAGFLDDTSTFPCRIKSVASWRYVAFWLGRLTNEMADPVGTTLARELSSFLGEMNMSDLTFEDAAIMELFLRSNLKNRLDGYMKAVRTTLQDSLPGKSKRPQQPAQYSYMGHMVWDWCYPNGDEDGYIAWGVHASEGSQLWQYDDLPRGTYCFGSSQESVQAEGF